MGAIFALICFLCIGGIIFTIGSIMQKEELGWLGGILFIAALMITIICNIYANKNMQQDLVNRRLAEYQMNPTNGTVTFVLYDFSSKVSESK